MFNTLNNTIPWRVLVLGTAALLTACGGGGSDAPMPTTGPARTAGSTLPMVLEHSTAGVAGFTRTQLPATSETSEPLPLPLGNTQLVTDDFAKPSAI
ncbi:MAG: hypothetical protein V4858_06175 [Pseudomonadota bacterium]